MMDRVSGPHFSPDHSGEAWRSQHIQRGPFSVKSWADPFHKSISSGTQLGDFELKKTSMNIQNDLFGEFDQNMKLAFPGKEYALLGKPGTDYVVLLTNSEVIRFNSLNLSSPKSLVRLAAECEAKDKRSVYIPNVGQPTVFLGARVEKVLNLDTKESIMDWIEQAEITGPIDTLPYFSQQKIKAVSVAPVLLDQREALGAIIVNGIIDPFLDLVLLRQLADNAAPFLKNSI